MKHFKYFLLFATLLSFNNLAAIEPVPDKMSPDYIRQRVEAIYQKPWDEIREADYMTDDYMRLFNQVYQLDAQHPDELGFYDYDHWYQTQDDPTYSKVTIANVDILNATDALVTIEIRYQHEQYFGEDTVHTKMFFPMKFERGDWYIDDIIVQDETGEADGGEKKFMQIYIDNGGQW